VIQHELRAGIERHPQLLARREQAAIRLDHCFKRFVDIARLAVGVHLFPVRAAPRVVDIKHG
jgi:hypothetical protein